MAQPADQQQLHPSKSSMLAFAVDRMIDNSETDFDLYLEIGDELSLYAPAPYHWLKDELGRLLAGGHISLYHFTADLPKAETYQLIHHKVVIDESQPPAKRLLDLTDAAAELTRILYHHPLTPTVIGKVRDIAKAMVACVNEDPTCITALGNLAHHDYYTYYHSARVCAYALAMSMQMTQRDGLHLTEIATGALLHDVGKSKINLDVLNKRGAFTPMEWEEMKLHPVHGDVLVADSLLSVAPRQIILHHHERLDGSGYPHNLTDHELLEEVKIVSFADVFDALTTNRPYQVSRTHFEALGFIRDKLLKNMHKDSYQALVALLSEPGKKIV